MLLLAAILLTYLAATYRRPLTTSMSRILASEWLVLLMLYVFYEAEFVPQDEAFVLYAGVFFMCFFIAYEAGRMFETPRVMPPVVFPQFAFFGLAFGAAALSLALSAGHMRGLGVESAIEYRSLFVDYGDAPVMSSRIGTSMPLVCGAWLLARLSGRIALAWIFGLLTFMLALLSTSKMFLVLALLFAFPTLGREGLNKKTLVWAGAIGLALFAVLHTALGKVVGEDQGLSSAILTTLKTYLLGGIAGAQLLTSGATSIPENVVWKPYADLLPGMYDVPATGILPWIQAGDWYVNVYTAFAYWLDALGWWSCAVMGLWLGIVYGVLQARPDSVPTRYIRLFALFPLLSMFHQDFFFAIGMWIAFCGAATLLWLTPPATATKQT
jgi:hypothetical protein